MDKITPEKAMKELIMVQMNLSRFNEDRHLGSSLDMSWKGYDFGVINDLYNKYNVKDWDNIKNMIVLNKAFKKYCI